MVECEQPGQAKAPDDLGRFQAWLGLSFEAAQAQQPEAAAQQRVDRAQAQAAEEVALVWADSQRERDELHAATHARLAALEETRTALRIRAERAEADLDTARAELQQLSEQLDKAGAHLRRPGHAAKPRSLQARRQAAGRLAAMCHAWHVSSVQPQIIGVEAD